MKMEQKAAKESIIMQTPKVVDAKMIGKSTFAR
jgi:hypothetical protein